MTRTAACCYTGLHVYGSRYGKAWVMAKRAKKTGHKVSKVERMEQGAPAPSLERAARDTPRARPGMRLVGYCKACRCFVELDKSLVDPRGHRRRDMAIIMELPVDKPIYHIPQFNWGAFLMPPIWGAGHGQVFAVVVYPMWLMADNLLWAAIHGQASVLLAALALAGTLAFMFFYARMANYVGYMRVLTTMSPDEYCAAERKWTIACAGVAVLMAVFATWYNLAVRV